MTTPNTDFSFTSRYGNALPDPATICKGQCEGMGSVPIQKNDPEAMWRDLWTAAHAEAHTFRARLKAAIAYSFLPPHRRIAILWDTKCDGWHLVKCPDCGGTGKAHA